LTGRVVGWHGSEHLLSKPDSKAGRLQRACLKLLREHERDGALPTNGRFVFYELEQRGVIPKAYAKGRKRTPAQDISDALTVLRTRGLVPWDWLTDETCELAEWNYADSVYEYVIEAAERATINPWGDQLPPLIICEARATKGPLEPTAGEYVCPITATGGQKHGFIVTDIVPLLKGNDRKVLTVCDCEVDGPADQIEGNTRRIIEQHTGRTFTAQTWSRVALTPEQKARNPRLRRLAIDKVDNRNKPPKRYRGIECEAVGQVTLIRLLRARLDVLLPEPLARVQVREQRQRNRLLAALKKLAHG